MGHLVLILNLLEATINLNAETIRLFCLGKPNVTESFPFGDNVLVFKVHNKIFLLLHLGEEKSFNAKCNPEKAIEFRNQYADIIPGYHMNKKHWNTVKFNGSLSKEIILELINQSYYLVFKALPKSITKND